MEKFGLPYFRGDLGRACRPSVTACKPSGTINVRYHNALESRMLLGCRGSIYLARPSFLGFRGPGSTPGLAILSAYKPHVMCEVNGIAGGILKVVHEPRGTPHKVWIRVG